MNTYLLISFQVIVFVTYIAVIWKKYGVLDSISDSWYSLGKNGPVFTFFIWAIALPMCFMNNIWYFLAGAFLCFTGAAADFKESMTDRVHATGAVGGIALALAGLTLSGLYWPIGVVLIASLGIRYSNIQAQTWWIEITAFIFIEAGIIHNLIQTT